MRFPKPFWRASKNSYYVQFGKRQISLRTDDEEEALKRYAELLAERDAKDTSDKRRVKVYQCFELFLEHAKLEHAERTYELTRDVLSRAAKSFGQVLVRELKQHHVTTWLRTMTLADSTKAYHIGKVKAALNYCVREGHLDENPLQHMKKPACATRDRILTTAERETIFASIKDQTFKDLILALQESGARPGEIAKLTAANINLDLGVITWVRHKTAKKTKKPRVIYMTPLLREIIERRLKETPEGGYLFVGRKGNPWNRHSFYSRFKKLRADHPELEGIVPYSFRHSWATDALEKGIPDATVAELMGHASPAILAKNYAHLEKKRQHLADMAKKARE